MDKVNGRIQSLKIVYCKIIIIPLMFITKIDSMPFQFKENVILPIGSIEVDNISFPNIFFARHS